MMRRDVALALLIVVVGALVTVGVCERIGVNEGLGWDGRAYASWAVDLPGVVHRRELDTFQAQRFLPSAAVYYADAALGIAHTNEHVIHGFQVLDCLALIVVCLCLCAAARSLGWSRRVFWIGFLSCFGGFAVARNALYAPVLTDDMALMLGAISLVGYLTGRAWLVACSLVVSLFVWPALIVVNAAALMFPRRALPEEPPSRAFGAAVGALFLCVSGAWFWKVLARYHTVEGMDGIVERTHRSLWPLTVATMIAMLALAGWQLGKQWGVPQLRSYLTKAAVVRAVVAGAFVVGCVALRDTVVAHLSHGQGFGLEALEYYYVGQALRAPLWSLVHHVVYFGPIVVVFVLAFGRIARTLRELGLAAFVAISASLMISVTPETRHLIAFLPWIVVFTVHATRDHWSNRAVVAYALLTLAWSKLWFPLHYRTYHNSFQFPDQRYMMHLGPWSTDAPFLIHGAAALVTAIVLVCVRPRSGRSFFDRG